MDRLRLSPRLLARAQNGERSCKLHLIRWWVRHRHRKRCTARPKRRRGVGISTHLGHDSHESADAPARRADRGGNYYADCGTIRTRARADTGRVRLELAEQVGSGRTQKTACEANTSLDKTTPKENPAHRQTRSGSGVGGHQPFWHGPKDKPYLRSVLMLA